MITFIRLGYRPVAFLLTGSSFPGMPPLPAYFHDKPNPDGSLQQYTRLSAKEYVGHIQKAIPLITARDPLVGGLRSSRPLVLLQDEATVHTARIVAQSCSQHSPRPIHLITLPTESPDLTPCDSSFFAAVKKKWNREVKGSELSWAYACQRAMELIEAQSPDPFIREMPLRWQACELVGGYHIEATLKQLRKGNVNGGA